MLLAHIQEASSGLPEPERAGATDIRDLLNQRREAAQRELEDALCQAWYVSLLNRVEQAVQEPRFEGTGSLARAVRKEHRRVRKLVRRLPNDPPDAALHELRRAIKHARYAAELAGAAGMPHAKSYVKRATTLQDLLGDHQDAVVAANELSNMDKDLTRPAAHLAVAELTQLQATRRAEVPISLPACLATPRQARSQTAIAPGQGLVRASAVLSKISTRVSKPVSSNTRRGICPGVLPQRARGQGFAARDREHAREC